MRRIGTVLMLITLFFTACSPDQAVKNYYRSYLTGDYVRAGRHVVSSQRELFERYAVQLRPDERRQLHRRTVHVRNVSTDYRSDTSAIATCQVLLKETDGSQDTLCRLVLLKKEGCRWKVSSGAWSER